MAIEVVKWTVLIFQKREKIIISRESPFFFEGFSGKIMN